MRCTDSPSPLLAGGQFRTVGEDDVREEGPPEGSEQLEEAEDALDLYETCALSHPYPSVGWRGEGVSKRSHSEGSCGDAPEGQM